MPSYRIPVGSQGQQQLQANLPTDGPIRLRLRWQPSDEHWYADLEWPVGTIVARGRRVVLDTPIVDSALVPMAGKIVCRSLLGASVDPGRNAWAETHALIHETPD